MEQWDVADYLGVEQSNLKKIQVAICYVFQSQHSFNVEAFQPSNCNYLKAYSYSIPLQMVEFISFANEIRRILYKVSTNSIRKCINDSHEEREEE